MSAPPNGPYLYDDDPEPLHTGPPRRRHGQIVALFVATVLVAVGFVVGGIYFRGTPADQSEEAVGVFLAALAADDVETAYELLCDDEQARVEPGEVAEEYVAAAPGEVVGSSDGGVEQLVRVRWADGSTSVFRVVSEQGARICGLR